MAYGIRRIREQPDNFDDLFKVVKNNIDYDKLGMHVDESDISIMYEDELQDKISIFNDDDLHMAYEWAFDNSKASLKLLILIKTKSTEKSTQFSQQ